MYDKYKDSRPHDTVARIKKLFSELGIEMHENLMQHSRGVYSVRLVDNEHLWATNGKGTTPEYALASAWGEAIERIQAHMAKSGIINKDLSSSYSFDFFPDDEPRLVADIPTLAPQVFESMKAASGTRSDEETISLWELILGGKMTNFTPYYDVRDKKSMLLPERAIKALSGSNGLCAGNTPEEAICEGMSEVFERHVKFIALTEGITPPEVPDGYLNEKYPELMEIAKGIESLGDFNIRVLDCSMGRQYPVVCVVLVDRANQRYFTSFGAHPVFAVALERCLTELCQGYAPGTRADEVFLVQWPSSVPPSSGQNVFRSFTIGTSVFPDAFFGGTPQWDFVPWKEGRSNKEFVCDMAKVFLDNAPGLYVRDHSFLGFPAYRIYVPGMSDAMGTDMSARALSNYGLYYKICVPQKTILNEDERRDLINAIEDPDNQYAAAAECGGHLPVRLDALLAALLYDSGENEKAAAALDRLARFDTKYKCAARELRMKDIPECERDRLLSLFFAPCDYIYVLTVWRKGSAVRNILDNCEKKVSTDAGLLDSLYEKLRRRMAGVKIDQNNLSSLF